MERRFVLFLLLAFAILLGHAVLMRRLNPQQAQPPEKAPQAARPPAGHGGAKGGPEKKAPAERKAPPEPEPAKGPKQPPKPPAQKPSPSVARQWGTLGSADPDDPYRMLVTWDNKGAAVDRVELNSPRYHDLEDRNGYLGHLMMDRNAIDKDDRGKGYPVQVVGPGTPAAEAGLKVGDFITAVGDQKISGVEDFRRALKTTRPKAKVRLTLLRDGKSITREVTLRWEPLEVIRPEPDAPPSFLLTLQQVKGQGMKDEILARDESVDGVEVGRELPGLDLWTGNWEVREADQTHVVFGRVLAKWDLEIVKSYRLEKVPTKSIKDANYGAYHLVLDVKIRNVAGQERMVAYQLDGPNGLPAEGAWYAYKISRKWFQAVGLRDVVVSFNGGQPSLIGCPLIADGKVRDLPWQGQPLSYIGVDAQYFSSVLLPQKGDPGVRLPPSEGQADLWFAQSQPLRLGKVDEQKKNLTNTSCRVVSQIYRLAPGGKPDDTLLHRFVVFAGPKKPAVLAHYDLGEVIYYGWFGPVARLMSGILHFFYLIVRNYGVAILLLTVLVRGCMFPLSRKQALGARKMQELQPEIKRLQEKYKNDMEARTKAQQELFRKHNYNPLSGCLVLFVQLPIFIGLYRSLMVDIELRDAPLLGSAIRWCSNLAAPDMLFDWSGFMPAFVTSGRGFFGLGPFFNILPVLTVVLFIMQQKMFMPPAVDEKAAQQQKIMQYMMIFIGLMFFKVASGLCIYFIASSLWGLAERKFLPQTSSAVSAAPPASRAEAKARDKPRPKPVPQQALSGRDGAAARRKKKGPRRGKK
jgi:YidC/Oxa1 family membrane protein insertase